MNKIHLFIACFLLSICSACTSNTKAISETNEHQTDSLIAIDTIASVDAIEMEPAKLTASNIQIIKELLYDKHTLDDTYPYKDTTRLFQWEQIKEHLALLENIQSSPKQWGILQNYRNRNGEAPLVKSYKRNAYRRIADTLGVERYQSVPLYLLTDTLTPVRYGQDGDLILIVNEEGSFFEAEPIFIGDNWMIPKKYIRVLQDTTVFQKAIFVDRTNQNIAALEQVDKATWSIRSMNPSTTGVHRPPYAQETPLGMFVLQEQKPKMIYLKDGTVETGGFAPYASRFTDGAYIHGVPVNAPRTALIEYSPSLGTTPRSHMCVRNATSHAKFIYDWAPVNQTIIFIIE